MGSSLHNSVGIGYNFYYLFLFLLVLFIFEISPRNKLQPPTDTQSPHTGNKSTMSTASFLTFATLLVLMTLSWSQPGEAAPTSDDGHPERAAGGFLGFQKHVLPKTCASKNQDCSLPNWHHATKLHTLPCRSGYMCRVTFHEKFKILEPQYGVMKRKQTCVWTGGLLGLPTANRQPTNRQPTNRHPTNRRQPTNRLQPANHQQPIRWQRGG